ncbi:MAG: carboxypeptidase regulatory-like domain-containing protein [Planctomycetes bacterium]|nr:carboxypeptidase regulatory-like domain-containing protein [Planctomycetota bacterium]
MLRLLASLAGLGLLALFLLLVRHDAPAGSFAALDSEVRPVLAAGAENASTPAAELEFVEDGDIGRVTGVDRPPRVYGRLLREDGETPVGGGSLRLVFEDYHDRAGSPEGAHEKSLADFSLRGTKMLATTVRPSGWWFVDLPGKCWIVRAEYEPKLELQLPPSGISSIPPGASHRPDSREELVTRRDLITTRFEIGKPLPSGKLDASFRIEPGLCQIGMVLDARTQRPVAGANVVLRSMPRPCLYATTDADGAFRMTGIDRSSLLPVGGKLTFVVGGQNHMQMTREVAWEDGQEGLVAFKVLLQPRVSGRR